MKQIIIHMGYNKSGSTTIQKWLYLNETRLLSERGVLYPKAGRQEFTHHRLGWATIGEHNLDLDAIVKELDDELTATDCEACVISTEALSLKPYFAAMRLADVFRRLGLDQKYKISIFGVIRRQSDWLQSEYNQRIEATKLTSNFPEFMTLNWANLYFYDVFARYQSEMPNAQVNVAWFEDLIKDGSAGLVRSVFETLDGGFDIDFSRYSMPQKENPSLTMKVSELKRRLNEIEDFELGSTVCRTFQQQAEKGRSPWWMSPAEEVAFLAKFEAQNRKVTETFGGGIKPGPLPWTPKGQAADPVPEIADPVAEAHHCLAGNW